MLFLSLKKRNSFLAPGMKSQKVLQHAARTRQHGKGCCSMQREQGSTERKQGGGCGGKKGEQSAPDCLDMPLFMRSFTEACLKYRLPSLEARESHGFPWVKGKKFEQRKLSHGADSMFKPGRVFTGHSKFYNTSFSFPEIANL